MKIAAITITYNDDYKFYEWYEHYKEYKDALYKHIIVDNGSTKKYLNLVKKHFSDSVIIERTTNGGCTGAYNDGIRLALSLTGVDSIMLLGNDIKISAESIYTLHSFLFSKTNYGMVSPAVLYPNTTRIDCYGSKLNFWGVDVRPYEGCDISLNCVPEMRICEYVTGGMNLAKIEFYQNIGLQDDKLFMYADELDMYLRAKKYGYLEAATKKAVAYHCHINPFQSSTRRPEMYYLHARNLAYLYKKHFSYTWLWHLICRSLISFVPFVLHPFNKDQQMIFINYCKGYYAGLRNRMDISFIAHSKNK